MDLLLVRSGKEFERWGPYVSFIQFGRQEMIFLLGMRCCPYKSFILFFGLETKMFVLDGPFDDNSGH